jgi:hypothetical protein
MADLRAFSMLDMQGLHRVTDEQVFTMQAAPRDIPLMTDTPINGVAAIVQDPNTLVGVAATTHQSTWFLSKETLIALTAQAARTAP